MRIALEEVIKRHKESNPNTDYIYDKTVLGKTLHDKMEEDDIYFNKKEDLLKYIQSKLDNIIEK